MGDFLPTEPGTQIQWSVRRYPRGCWKCKLRRLAGRGFRHWNCGPGPKITEYVNDSA